MYREIHLTQICTTPFMKGYSTETGETVENEYTKVRKDVDVNVDVDTYAHNVYRQETKAGAGTQFCGHARSAAAPFAKYYTVTVKHACKEVTTEHCVVNPNTRIVPEEVQHCHSITKVTCANDSVSQHCHEEYKNPGLQNPLCP